MTPDAPSDPQAAPPPLRSLFASTFLSRAICFLIANLALILVARLLLDHTPLQFHWSTQMLIAAGMLLTSSLVSMHIWLHWMKPTAAARSLLAQIRQGQAPIEELGNVGGGVAPLLAEIQNVLRDLRRQKAEVARVEIETTQRIANKTDALERSLGAIRQQASRDALTGLYNRRMLDTLLPQILQKCRADAVPLSLMMIDVDDFKLLNDTLGHMAGDEFLRNVGQLVRSTLRESDLAFRYGGDEFVILVPNHNLAQATAVGQRLASLVDSLTKPLPVDRPPRLSIGVLCSHDLPREAPAELFIGETDRILYDVKIERKAQRKKSHAA